MLRGRVNSRFVGVQLRFWMQGFIVIAIFMGVGLHALTTTLQLPSVLALLAACLPGWREVLRPGGVAALSWNLYTLPRDAMIAEAEKAGFAVLTGGAYENLAHRVDSSILRDAAFFRRV